MRRVVALLSLIALLAVAALGSRLFASLTAGAAEGPAVLRFAAPGSVAPNETFAVDVVVENVANLGAFDVTATFDNTRLEYMGLVDGGFLSSTGRDSQCIRPAAGPNGETREQIANQYGALHYGCTTFGLDDIAGPDGEGVLVTLNFRALAPGSAALTFVGLASAYVIGDPLEPVDAGFTGLASVESCSEGVCSDINIAFTPTNGTVEIVDGATNTPVPEPTEATLPQPASGFYMAIDCDVVQAGVQIACNYPAGTTSVDVDVVVGNVDQPATDIAAFEFELTTFGGALQPSAPPARDGALAGGWNCELVAPIQDDDPNPEVAHSQLTCFVSVQPSTYTPLPTSATVRVARMTFAVQQGAALLDFGVGYLLDSDGAARVDCVGTLAAEAVGVCADASVSIGAAHVSPTPTPTSTPTTTPTNTLVVPERTPSGTPTGAVTDVMGFNQQACITGAIRAGFSANNAVLSVCSQLDYQSGMQFLVDCLRTGVVDEFGRMECNREFVRPLPAELAALDRDADQVHAPQSIFAIAFVDGDYPVLFESDAGRFFDLDQVDQGQSYLCYGAGLVFDPDCDASLATQGDGVVVARLVIDETVPRGEHVITVTQNGVSKEIPFTVTGPPDRIEAEIVGKSTIATGAPDCEITLNPDDVAGDAQRTFAVARAYDSDNRLLANVWLEWEFPFSSNTGNTEFRTTSDIAGSASLGTTFDLGGQLGIAAPQVICGKSVPGTLPMRVIAVPIFEPLGNPDAVDLVSVNVVEGSPTATPTAVPTFTPTPTATGEDTPTAVATFTETPTPTPTDVGFMTVTPTATSGSGDSTPTLTPTAGPPPPVQAIALSPQMCLGGSALAGVPPEPALAGCGGLSDAALLHDLVSCINGRDIGGDGTNDCVASPPIGGRIFPDYFRFVDLDENQVQQGLATWILAFVEDEGEVTFEADGLEFADVWSGYEPTPGTWICTADADCDGDPSTAGDGVVVALVTATLSTARGTHAVTVTQGEESAALDVVVTGAPVTIAADVIGKTTIETGAVGCEIVFFPEQLEDEPDQTFARARALDSDGTPLAAVFIEWEFPAIPFAEGRFPNSTSEVGRVASAVTFTAAYGAFGVAAPQTVCGTSAPGIFSPRLAFIDVFNSPYTDFDEIAQVSLEVVTAPTATVTPTPTETPFGFTATPTPTPPTFTPTPTIDFTRTAVVATARAEGTQTAIAELTATRTPDATGTAAAQQTGVAATFTAAAGSGTELPTFTPTPSIGPSVTPTQEPAQTSVPTVTSTVAATNTIAATSTGSPTETVTPTATTSVAPTATRTSGAGGGGGDDDDDETPTRTRTAVVASATSGSGASGGVASATSTRVSSVLGGASTPRSGITAPDTGTGGGGAGGARGWLALVLGATAVASIGSGALVVRLLSTQGRRGR